MAAKKQFRPVFTESQIMYLYHLTSACPDTEGKRLHAYLASFKLKISSGLNSAAYETKEKISLLDSIGGSEPTPSKILSYEQNQKLLRETAEKSLDLLSPAEKYEYLMGLKVDDTDLSEEQTELLKQVAQELYGDMWEAFV